MLIAHRVYIYSRSCTTIRPPCSNTLSHGRPFQGITKVSMAISVLNLYIYIYVYIYICFGRVSTRNHGDCKFNAVVNFIKHWRGLLWNSAKVARNYWSSVRYSLSELNILRSKKDGHHFANDILDAIFDIYFFNSYSHFTDVCYQRSNWL